MTKIYRNDEFARSVLTALDPKINLDGVSSEEMIHESQLAIATILQDRALNKRDSINPDLEFERGILIEMGYNLDGLSPKQIREHYVEAVTTSVKTAKLRRDAETEDKQLSISLELPIPIAKDLLWDINVPNKETPENLHITIAYFGRFPSIPSQEELFKAITEFTTYQYPLVGDITGHGRFMASDSSDNMDVLIALPNLPTLVEMRSALLALIERGGFGLQARRNFGYLPHIALAYILPEQKVRVELKPLPLRFDAIVVNFGRTRYRFSLLGQDVALIKKDEEMRQDVRKIWVKDPTTEGGGYFRAQTREAKQYPGKTPKIKANNFLTQQEFEHLTFEKALNPFDKGINSSMFVKNEYGGQFIMKTAAFGAGAASHEIGAEVICSQAAEVADVPCQIVRVAPQGVSNDIRSKNGVSTVHTLVNGIPLRQAAQENPDNPLFKDMTGFAGMQSTSHMLLISGSDESCRNYIKTMCRHPDLARIAALDIYLANGDRHINNIFYDKHNDRMTAIDNGSAIPAAQYPMDYSPTANLKRYLKDSAEHGLVEELGLNDREVTNLKILSQTLDDLMVKMPKQRILKGMDQAIAVGKPPANQEDKLKDWEDYKKLWKSKGRAAFNGHIEVTVTEINGILKGVLD